MSLELKRLEKLYDLYLKMDKYSVLIKGEQRLFDIVKIKLDKEKEVAYIIGNDSVHEVDSSVLKINLGNIIDCIEGLIHSINLEYSHLKDTMTDEEYIDYVGSISLAKGKYKEIESEFISI